MTTIMFGKVINIETVKFYIVEVTNYGKETKISRLFDTREEAAHQRKMIPKVPYLRYEIREIVE